MGHLWTENYILFILETECKWGTDVVELCARACVCVCVCVCVCERERESERERVLALFIDMERRQP